VAITRNVEINQVSANTAYVRLYSALTGNDVLYGAEITSSDYDNLNVDVNGDRLEVTTSFRSYSQIQHTTFTTAYKAMPLRIDAEFEIKSQGTNILKVPVKNQFTTTIDRNFDTLTIDTPSIYIPGAVQYMQNIQASGSTDMVALGNNYTVVYLYLRGLKNA